VDGAIQPVATVLLCTAELLKWTTLHPLITSWARQRRYRTQIAELATILRFGGLNAGWAILH